VCGASGDNNAVKRGYFRDAVVTISLFYLDVAQTQFSEVAFGGFQQGANALN
jgi:hypothetical protein